MEFETILDYLGIIFYGNSLKLWLTALALTVIVWCGLLIARKVACDLIRRLVERTNLAWDDVLGAVVPRTHWIFLLSLALLAGTRVLELRPNADDLLIKGVVIVGLIQLGLWVTCLVNFFVDSHRERRLKEDPASVTTIGALALLSRLGIWILVALLILGNAGVEIAPLLAGLGVGGIALALAVQTVLKDLLASLSIMLDKPFVVGDFVNVGDLMGVVEHIGIKSTRVRSLSGEQLVFANNDLLESRLRNFGRMKERRVAFTIGVTYQTPRAQLAKIPGIIKAAIESQELTRFDRSHFNKYGDFSLNIESVFYVGTPDYNKWMDIQQAINLKIHEEFEKEGIQFAYPTQTVFMIPQGSNSAKTGSEPS